MTKIKTYEYNNIIYEDPKVLFRENESHPSVKENNFLSRLKNGWSEKDALLTPKDGRGRKTKEEVEADTVELTTRDKLLLRLKEVSGQSKFNQPRPAQDELQADIDNNGHPYTHTLSKPLEKRVTLYFARVLLGKEERAIIGFTTEQKPTDLDMVESDILLLSRVSFTTAGNIQKEITEYFSGRTDEEKTKELSSSQCFNFEGDEFYEALDYIYLLIASYQ